IYAVVQIGSTLRRSACGTIFSTDSAVAGAVAAIRPATAIGADSTAWRADFFNTFANAVIGICGSLCLLPGRTTQALSHPLAIIHFHGRTVKQRTPPSVSAGRRPMQVSC